MEYISRYFNMELMDGEKIVNVYSIPVSTFSITDENELTSTLSEIFNGMLSDLIYGKKTLTVNNWDLVNFYVVDDDYKSLEILKTKNEMEQYPSYGEGVLLIYNQIINNN
jgi:hypothetical protein